MSSAHDVRARVLEDKNELLDLLVDLLREATRVRLVSGWVLRSGIGLLHQHVPRFEELARTGRLTLIGAQGRVERGVLDWFAQRGASSSLLVVPKEARRTLHAKAWLLETPSDHVWSIIGSTNLSKSALTSNHELDLWVPTPREHPFATELGIWFEHLRSIARVATAEDCKASLPESEEGDQGPQPSPSSSPPAASPPPTGLTREAALAFLRDALNLLVKDHLCKILRRNGCDDRANRPELAARILTGVGTLVPAADIVGVPRIDDLRSLAVQHGLEVRAAYAADARHEIVLQLERALGKRPSTTWPVQPAEAPTAGVRRIVEGAPAPPLEPHQENALSMIRQRVVNPADGMILSLPTASGKTRVALAWLLRDAVARGRRVLWVAHSEDLLAQVVEALEDCAADARSAPDKPAALTLSGYWGSCPIEWKSLNGDIVVASIQSLHANGISAADFRAARADQIHAVVVDEAHHVPAPTWKGFLDRLGPVRRLGLSATPERTNPDEDKHVTRFFPCEHWGAHLEAHLRREGYLSLPMHHQVRLAERVEITSDDEDRMDQFHEVAPALLARLARSEKRQRAIVDEYRRIRSRHGQRRTLLFAIDKEHAFELTARMRREGIAVELLLSGEQAPSERTAILQRFREGAIELLCNVRIAAEGVDVPAVDTLLMTRPTMSYGLYRQMLGRGLRGPRWKDGTEKCIVVDFVDNLDRFNSRLQTAERNRVGEPLS